MRYYSSAAAVCVLCIHIYILETELNWKRKRKSERDPVVIRLPFHYILYTKCASVVKCALADIIWTYIYIYVTVHCVICVNPILFSNTFISFAMKLFVYACVLYTRNHKNFTTRTRYNSEPSPAPPPLRWSTFTHPFHSTRLPAWLTHLNLYVLTVH